MDWHSFEQDHNALPTTGYVSFPPQSLFSLYSLELYVMKAPLTPSLESYITYVLDWHNFEQDQNALPTTGYVSFPP